MSDFISVFFAGVIGFSHAFEADHLVAVAHILTKRKKLKLALKDGIFWGLGHTSTILAVGLVIVIGRLVINEKLFYYIEACVGLMLLLIGIYRLLKVWRYNRDHNQMHLTGESNHHHFAYGIGMVHGLAGSGALILLVMAKLKEPISILSYLTIFGLGSVAGMLVASGIFSLSFSKWLVQNPKIQLGLVTLSSLLCIAFGCTIVYEQLVS